MRGHATATEQPESCMLSLCQSQHKYNCFVPQRWMVDVGRGQGVDEAGHMGVRSLCSRIWQGTCVCVCVCVNEYALVMQWQQHEQVEQYARPTEQKQEHVKKKINTGSCRKIQIKGWRMSFGDTAHLGSSEKMTGVKSVCQRNTNP